MIGRFIPLSKVVQLLCGSMRVKEFFLTIIVFAPSYAVLFQVLLSPIYS